MNPKPTQSSGNSRYWKYLPTLLIYLLSFLLVLNLLVPDSAYSFVENRPLKSFPAPSIGTIVDGSYGREMESYASDQFLGRNFLFHVNYLIRKLSGQREIDDVFLGQGALLQQNSLPAPGFLENQINVINQFAGLTGIPTTVLVSPSAATIQPSKLPALAPVNDINGSLDLVYNGLGTLKTDVRKTLQDHSKEYIFYRTDHHWTSQGAKLAAIELMGTFGQSISSDEFDSYKVSDHFEGTLASKTGSVNLHDEIYICPDKKRTEYIVTWGDGAKTASIYDRGALNQKDQYELFLGRNQSLVHIETLSESQENLLIFKDSYANSMIQFLLPYYRNIYIVDPRYYYDDLAFLLAIGEISQCAFIFCGNTFFTDSSLQDVLNPYIASLTPAQEEGQPEA